MSEIMILNNRYQLETQLGSGGMAVVYKARDLMLERTVSIKVLRKAFSGDPAFGERFRQEAKAAANLSHPNIVTVHDFGFDKGRLFIVMEFIPGITLKTMIDQRGRLTTQEAIPLVVQACAGIGYAHRAGLVHCDVKPQNILVTPDKRVKVTDFGIARALASIRSDEKSEVVWGSPQYFSPEQAAGKAPSPASDVYGIGVILFEMLTGQLPFIASSTSEFSRLHRETPPPEPRHLNPAIDENLNRIILKILSKEPSSRYRTADQLGRVLITFSSKTGIASVPRTPSRSEGPHPAPAQRPAPKEPQPAAQRMPIREAVAPSSNPLGVDWITIGLGLAALLSVGGLIPFWLWVYFSLNQ
ncbi:MAG: protein kinase [Anaerolineales bacterium]|jgi:serine/threonine protein kinase|nr:protein kinase [Anaerolineales bacterium]